VGIPLAYLLRENFDNEARLGEILRSKRPPDITIVHGDRDEVIPVEMGRALAASHPGAIRYFEIEGGSHNSVVAREELLLYREMRRIDIQDPNP
jgi:pimeloyl-ACP methyl ester carboxylesterase